MRLHLGDKAAPFSTETIDGKRISLEPLAHFGPEMGDHLAVPDVDVILTDLSLPVSFGGTANPFIKIMKTGYADTTGYFHETNAFDN